MSDKIEKLKEAVVLCYPVCIDKNISGEWFTKEIFVNKGDIFTITFQSNSNSGAFTTFISGSVSGLFNDGAIDHSDTIYGARFTYTSPVAQNITFRSYSNTSAVMTCAITIIRK